MASLKAIRKRIGTVKNTQKITRAMKMVAAARLRKAQQRIVEMRPYAIKTFEVLSSVAARAGEEETHPLLARRKPERVMCIILTSDRGLAGGFNANVNKHAFRWIQEMRAQGKEVSVAIIGRKGRDYFRRRNIDIRHEFTNIYEQFEIKRAQEIAAVAIDEYTRGDLDAVYLVYNEFKSAIAQRVVQEPLLPITPLSVAGASAEGEASRPDTYLADFIYEPSKRVLLDRLLPMYMTVEVWRALLESVASEHGARMTAMDAATKNASELIGGLTLQFNRARQAAITKELMEIIGGAEALR